MEFRKLLPNDIECRLMRTGATTNGAWCNVLLYKDARCDMKILDETAGQMNWESDFEVINGNLFAEVRIWDDKKLIWISKKDVGTESKTEKEKGQASDAFKRACFKWGIGRELYSSPVIFISLDAQEYTKEGENVYMNPKVKFYVKEIDYDKAGKINKLIIVDQKGNERFTTSKAKKPDQPQDKAANKTDKTPVDKVAEELNNLPINELQVEELILMMTEAGIKQKQIEKTYSKKIKELNSIEYDESIAKLVKIIHEKENGEQR